MFDIGFWELCLVALVALLVFGPERLPEVARVAGLWIGRIRRIMANFKAEIDQELHMQELQETFKQNQLRQLMHETKNNLTPPAEKSTSTESPDTLDKPSSSHPSAP